MFAMATVNGGRYVLAVSRKHGRLETAVSVSGDDRYGWIMEHCRDFFEGYEICGNFRCMVFQLEWNGVSHGLGFVSMPGVMDSG